MGRQVLREVEHGGLVRPRHQAKFDIAGIKLDGTGIGTRGRFHVDRPEARGPVPATAADRVGAGDQADMAAFKYDLFLVGPTDLGDSAPRRLIGHDVVMLSDSSRNGT